MGSQEFIQKCKELVHQYTLEHMDATDVKQKASFQIEDVFVVWSSKVLQNNKALLSTNIPDGMYYELTHNGDKGEIYLDAYKKVQNIKYEI